MTARFDKFKTDIDATLNDASKPWKTIFDIFEEKTGLPRLYGFIGAVTLFGLYLVFGLGAQLICNAVGLVYPAYVSIRAIETSTKNDDTRWLVYWVTYASLSVIEYFSAVLCAIIPCYWLLKSIFLIWCMLPIENNGSKVIYTRIIRPNFIKHHPAADRFINEVTEGAKKSAAYLLKEDGRKSD